MGLRKTVTKITSFPIIRTLTRMPPKDRLKYVNEHPEELEELNESALDEVGRLLCHASPKSTRDALPIDRDLRNSGSEIPPQEQFENSLFGSATGEHLEGAFSSRYSSDTQEEVVNV